MLVFDTSRQWAHLFLPEHICFAWAHLFCLSDVVYVVQKCIKLFHLTATTIVSFYTCTYIPVGFVVKVVGCYLKIVPSYKFSQHNKKHLRLHSKTFIINWHNSFSLRMNLFWNRSFHQFLWSSLGIRLRVKMVDWCFCFVLYCRVQKNLFKPGINILTSPCIFSILFLCALDHIFIAC